MHYKTLTTASLFLIASLASLTNAEPEAKANPEPLLDGNWLPWITPTPTPSTPTPFASPVGMVYGASMKTPVWEVVATPYATPYYFYASPTPEATPGGPAFKPNAFTPPPELVKATSVSIGAAAPRQTKFAAAQAGLVLGAVVMAAL